MRKIIISSFFVISLCISLALLNTVYAAPAINAEGAVLLKKQIEDGLQWRIDMAKTLGQGLSAEGAPEVTPKESFYAVKLPHLSISYGAEKGKLDIGTILATVKPGQLGEWITDVTFPGAMTFYKNDLAAAVIVLDKQHFSGNWWPEKEMYSKFDALYQNVQVKGAGVQNTDALLASIKEFKAVLDLKENTDGTWSGGHVFETDGIQASIPGEHATDISIQKVTSSNTYDRLNIQQSLDIKKKLQTLFKGDKVPNDSDTRILISELMAKSQSLVDGMSSSAEIHKVVFREKDAAPGVTPKEIFFDKLAFSGSTLGMRQEKSNARFKSNLTGLKISSVPADISGIVPHTFNADIAVNNLPGKKLMETIFAAMQKAAALPPEDPAAPKTGPTPAETEIAAALGMVPKMLQEAGTVLTIQDTFLTGKDVDSTLAGKIMADPGATLGATGKITLSIKGLDDVIQKLKDQTAKPGADPQLMGYISALSMFQMVGKEEKGSDGKSLREFVLEMTPDGQVLMNGADIKLLASAFTPKPPTPENKYTPAPVLKAPVVPAPAVPAPEIPQPKK